MENQVYTLQRLNACRLKDLQCMKLFSGHLSGGIVALTNICKSLLDAHVNTTTGMCSNYKEIRENIEHAEQCMKKAEEIIEEKLGCLDQRMEQLIGDKQKAEQQKKGKSMAIDKLLKEKASAEQLLQISKAALDQATKHIESAQFALNVAQQRMDTNRGVAIAGGVLLAIPFIGWIAGPIMLSEGLRALNEATNVYNTTEREKQMTESKVRECTNKIYKCEKNIVSAQNEIEMSSQQLKKIEEEIKGVQKDLEDTGSVQQMVRRVMNCLSVLTGRVTVLERQTQSFILWEPVVEIMKDVVKAILNIAKNDFFGCNDVQGLINTLNQNVGSLRALCNSPSHSEYNMFY